MLTRRHFLKQSAVACLASAVASVEPVPSQALSCRPATSGTLWWVSPEESDRWRESGWRKELEQQRTLRFDLLWLTNAHSLIESPLFSLKQLLDLCAELNLRVIIDTGVDPNWYGALDLKKELEFCGQNITRIGRSCSSHPAFHAWYIPHEIYMCWGAMDDYIQQLYPALVQACKKAASLPVAVSPFFILDRTKVFGDFQFNEPDEYRDYWARLIKNSGLDCIMLQDSGEHFSYVTNAQRRPFYVAMSQACRQSGARFWANVEVAEMECASLEEYVRRYGRIHHSKARDIPWRPVPMQRLRDKLNLASEYAENIVSWGYQQFCRPNLGARAEAWFDEYRKYRRTVA